jgi:hypothetical protein
MSGKREGKNMKYKKLIIEDDFPKYVNLHEMSRKSGIAVSTLSRVRSGITVVSEKFHDRLLNLLTEFINNDKIK